MSMLIWNVRGLNKIIRRKDVKKHIQNLHPSVVGLIETKVKPSKSHRISKCIPPTWSFCNNYSYSNRGRIWVAWDTNIWAPSFQLVSLQQITLQLKNKGGLEIFLSVVYGEYKQTNRNDLWSDI